MNNNQLLSLEKKIQINISSAIQNLLPEKLAFSITITKVELTNDSSIVTIFFNSTLSEKEMLEKLKNKNYEIKKYTFSNWNKRRIPKLIFKIDNSLLKQSELEELFSKIKDEK